MPLCKRLPMQNLKTPAMVALVTCLLAVAGCHPPVKSTLPGPPTRTQLAELWSEPAATRDLFWGVGGKGLAPDPAATYTVIEIKQGGFSRGYTVTGPGKREWSVKFPPEAPTEVVASRILWGVGYHQPPIYYVQRWQADKATQPNPQLPARFREKDPAINGGSKTPASGRTTRTRSSARRRCAGCSSCRRCSETPISRTSRTPTTRCAGRRRGAHVVRRARSRPDLRPHRCARRAAR